jgi:hypothetical protein
VPVTVGVIVRIGVGDDVIELVEVTMSVGERVVVFCGVLVEVPVKTSVFVEVNIGKGV